MDIHGTSQSEKGALEVAPKLAGKLNLLFAFHHLIFQNRTACSQSEGFTCAAP